MAVADVYYKQLLAEVLDNGVPDVVGKVRPSRAGSSPAHSISIFGEQVKFKAGELPIITTKKTPVQSSINEVVHAFFRLKTNRVSDFESLGIGYWGEWANENGTIGLTYGRQLLEQTELIRHSGNLYEMNQVSAILHRLEHDPFSRRIMFSYWNPKHTHKNPLQECAYTGQFNVRPNARGRMQLDFILVQRSVDLLLGLPSNWAGYYALQCAMANLFDYEVGTFTHQMGNVHLYDYQVELARELIDAPEYNQPSIYVNPDVTNFYDYGLDDIKYVDYKHGKSFRTEETIWQ